MKTAGQSAKRTMLDRHRLVRVAVVAAMAATGFGSFMTTATAAKDCATRGRVTTLGDWTQITSPDFGGGAPQIVSYAVDPVSPQVIYVTNGLSVLKSMNGGCDWNPVFSVATASPLDFPGFNAVTTAIADMTIPSSASGFDTLYLLVNQAGTAVMTVVSQDGGVTWKLGSRGLSANPAAGLSISASPTDPGTAYFSARFSPGGRNVGTGYGLFRSTDFGTSWRLMTKPQDIALAPWRYTEVDALNPDHVWGWGNGCVCLSKDGGASFTRLLNPEGDVPALEVFHPPGRPARLIAFSAAPTDPGAGPQVYYRSDDGGARWATGQTPDGVVSAVNRGSHEIFAATTQQSSRSVLGHLLAEEEWRPLGGGSFPRITDLTIGLGVDSPVFGNAGDGLVRFGGSLDNTESDIAQFITTPGRNSSTIAECPPPGPPAPWAEGWDPAPANEPVYVTNFDTGYTVKYDSHGSGSIVAIAPRYSEGMTLDPLGRLITTTRFSNQVTRLDPDTCKLEMIDFDLFTAEGPTYDREGNLYVVDTNNYYVWRYRWPQYPRQIPELIWRMPGYLEDLKIGPPGHPYEGYLFVLYRDRRKDVDDPRVCSLAPCPLTGNPNAIALLKPTDNPKYRGFKRLDNDFVHLGPGAGPCSDGGFQSLGMAFLPNGHLLVPDMCGSGIIRDYAPNGTFETFAHVAPPNAGVLMLTKIAVTGSGYVYVTGNTNGCRPGENQGAWLFRFDSTGRALEPPFTHHLSCAVGVAAPSGFPIPPLPPVVGPPEPEPPLPRPVPPVRGAAVAPLSVPPPPIIVPAPVPAPAPIVEMAPAPAPNPAPAQAANPVAAAVAQEQEQPQLAFVTAANAVREQVGDQFAMARVSRPANPLQAAKFVLVSGSLMLVAAYGYVTLAFVRTRARVRVRRGHD